MLGPNSGSPPSISPHLHIPISLGRSPGRQLFFTPAAPSGRAYSICALTQWNEALDYELYRLPDLPSPQARRLELEDDDSQEAHARARAHGGGAVSGGLCSMSTGSVYVWPLCMSPPEGGAMLGFAESAPALASCSVCFDASAGGARFFVVFPQVAMATRWSPKGACPAQRFDGGGWYHVTAVPRARSVASGRTRSAGEESQRRRESPSKAGGRYWLPTVGGHVPCYWPHTIGNWPLAIVRLLLTA